MKLFHFLALAALTEANPSIANPCGFTKCIDPDTGKKCKLAVAAEVGEEPKIYKNCGEVFPQEENPGVCITYILSSINMFLVLY